MMSEETYEEYENYIKEKNKEQNEKIEKLKLSRTLTEKLQIKDIYTLTQLLDVDIYNDWESGYDQIRSYEKEKLINLIHMLGLKFNCEFGTEEEEKQIQSKIIDEIRSIGLTKYIEKKGSPKYEITMIEELVHEAHWEEGLIDFLDYKHTFIKKYRDIPRITTIKQLLDLDENQFNTLFSRRGRKDIIEEMHKLGYKFSFEPPEKEQRQINIKMDNGEVITVENVDVLVNESKRTEVPQSDDFLQDIKTLNLSYRVNHCLHQKGIVTLSGLLRLTKDELKKIRNLGQKSYDEIVDKIHSLGYKFADEMDLEFKELESGNSDMHQIMIDYKKKLARMQELQQQIQLLQQEKQKLDQEIDGFKQQLGEQLGGKGTTK